MAHEKKKSIKVRAHLGAAKDRMSLLEYTILKLCAVSTRLWEQP